ncbi:MAG: thermonuclease family protein [Alphaproteobacteria bacterium]|nr:thermonuclease family protein [Alphaproteobacteria bacterium]
MRVKAYHRCGRAIATSRWAVPVSIVFTAGLVAGPESAAKRAAPASDRTQSCSLEAGPRHTAVRIKDSETLVLDDGRVVRLLGILAPKPPLTAKDNDTWQPEANARTALRSLVEGIEVALAFDSRRKDRYGRLLAHVFAWHGGRRYWVQGELLANGHARAIVLPDNTRCADELLAHERVARDSSRGLWRRRSYRILKPKPERWLLQKRHSFQIVEGRVAAVAIVKGKIYLNFGNNWRRDFTASLQRKALVGSTVTVDRLTALKGKRVRVRGWIERNNGPLIKLAHPALIEVLDAKPMVPNEEHFYRTPEMADTPGDNGSDPKKAHKRRLKTPRIKKRPVQLPPDALDL